MSDNRITAASLALLTIVSACGPGQRSSGWGADQPLDESTIEMACAQARNFALAGEDIDIEGDGLQRMLDIAATIDDSESTQELAAAIVELADGGTPTPIRSLLAVDRSIYNLCGIPPYTASVALHRGDCGGGECPDPVSVPCFARIGVSDTYAVVDCETGEVMKQDASGAWRETGKSPDQLDDPGVHDPCPSVEAFAMEGLADIHQGAQRLLAMADLAETLGDRDMSREIALQWARAEAGETWSITASVPPLDEATYARCGVPAVTAALLATPADACTVFLGAGFYFFTSDGAGVPRLDSDGAILAPGNDDPVCVPGHRAFELPCFERLATTELDRVFWPELRFFYNAIDCETAEYVFLALHGEWISADRMIGLRAALIASLS